MNSKIINLYILIFFILITFFATQSRAADSIGVFNAVNGRVNVLKRGKLPGVNVLAGDLVFETDIIRAKSRSSAEILFTDGTYIFIAEKSRVDISSFSPDKTKILKLPRGMMRTIVNGKKIKRIKLPESGKRLEIHTPNAVAGVRGTDFLVFHNINTTSIFVNEGNVYAYNPRFPENVITVTAGNVTLITPEIAPKKPRTASRSEKKNFIKKVTLNKGKADLEKKEGDKAKEKGGIDKVSGKKGKNILNKDRSPKGDIENRDGRISDKDGEERRGKRDEDRLDREGADRMKHGEHDSATEPSDGAISGDGKMMGDGGMMPDHGDMRPSEGSDSGFMDGPGDFYDSPVDFFEDISDFFEDPMDRIDDPIDIINDPIDAIDPGINPPFTEILVTPLDIELRFP